MKLYLLDSPRRISPFGDPTPEVRILDRPLARYVEQAAVGAGLEPERVESAERIGPGPALVVSGDLFVTRSLLRLFARTVRGREEPGSLALPDGPFTRQNHALMELRRAPSADGGEPSWVYPLHYVPGAPPTEGWDALPPIPVRFRERALRPDNLERLQPEAEFELAMTPQAAIEIRHWSHLLDANLYALAAEWADLRPGLLARYLWALIRTPSLNRYRMMQRLVRRGRGCRIHPQAVVEASILGDGVEIEAGALVRGCYVGDGAKVERHAEVSFSVLGAHSVAGPNSIVHFSVLYPRALVSVIGAQGCVVGAGASQLASAFAMDMQLDFEEIRVRQEGRPVRSGKRLLGACLGHDAVVAAGVLLAPGTEVPNGRRIIRHPAEIVRRVPEDLPAGEPLVLRDGRLTPLRARPRRRRTDTGAPPPPSGD